ncbi:hypothetical protein HYW20_01565 [Candidatus Woesearchaeota archaeon]|nr:hypothetical protein [Candidatus Woesearchaeota archaeon]
MPELEQKSYQRQVAYKIRISDILNSSFVKDELSAGYVKFANFNVSRANIIATLISKSEQPQYSSSVIDDASGKILLRSFYVNAFSKFDVGDVVLVIGRIREFNGERYIMPEILKKLEGAGWINVRKLELGKTPVAIKETVGNEDNPQHEDNAAENIYLLIKKLDDGDGASVDDIIKNSGSDSAEIIINRLLENGDVFEIKPGKLKVLE